jgi:hypothetical protein
MATRGWHIQQHLVAAGETVPTIAIIAVNQVT